mgnify:CR=1 FL=1
MGQTDTVALTLWGGPKDGELVQVPQFKRPALLYPSPPDVEPRIRHEWRWVSNEYRHEPRREYVYVGANLWP